MLQARSANIQFRDLPNLNSGRTIIRYSWRTNCFNRGMHPAVKGMVQVQGVTYRIVRVRLGVYDVVRVLDDASIGNFKLGMGREVQCDGAEPSVVREVARAAMQHGRTSWAPRRRPASSQALTKVTV